MTKTAITYEVGGDGKTVVFNCGGVKKGYQNAIADILRGLAEMFTEVRQKNQVVIAKLMGDAEAALKQLRDALCIHSHRLSIEASEA